MSEIVTIDREACTLGDLGLKLDESGKLLSKLQDLLVHEQLRDFTNKPKVAQIATKAGAPDQGR